MDAVGSNNEYHGDVVREGDTIVVHMHDERSRCLITVGREKTKIDRTTLSVACLIGAPYGSVWELNNRDLTRIVDEEVEEDVGDGPDGVGDENMDTDAPASSSSSASAPSVLSSSFNSTTSTVDIGQIGGNAHFFDDNSAQKLNHEDIAAMRETGSSGMTIIKSLIKNSDTFASKTTFSQQKWIKRKKQKYCRRFRIVKPTPKAICDVYHAKAPNKICNMRWDTLAQTLSFSGVFANAKVLVFESCLGLVTGAVAYRMRGHGSIVAMYPGQQPHNELVGRLNLDEKSTGIIEPVSSGELTKAVDYVLEHGFLSEELAAEELAKRPDTTDVCRKFQRGKCKYGDECRHRHVLIPGYAEEEEEEDWTGAADSSEGPAASPATTQDAASGDAAACSEAKKPSIPKKFQIKSYDRPRYERSGRQPEELVRNQLKLRQGFSSFILASKFHPLGILQSALKLLLPSSSFVIFCEYMEPLLECFEWLHGKTEAIELMMADTWLREYQTLPGRYHPLMSIPASGGYLLSGIYLGCNIKKPAGNPAVAGVAEGTSSSDAAAV